MYIQPNGTIKLFRGIPFEDNYEDTILFETPAQQLGYFAQHIKYTFVEQTYTRVKRGRIRVQATAENLYDCNYMSFVNNGFNPFPKTFYAFITSVEYVNNITSEIGFEIDPIQTWMFDYSLRECLVEREHTETDGIGEHLVPEQLDQGEIMVNELAVPNCPFTAGDYKIIIARTFVEHIPPIPPTPIMSNVFNGLEYVAFDDAISAHNYIQTWANQGKADEIIAIYTVPSLFWFNNQDEFWETSAGVQIKTGLEQDFTTIGSHTVRNKKLFSEQYFGIVCKSSSGDSAKYSYEYFSNPNEPTFKLHFSLSNTPTALIYPEHYKGSITPNEFETLQCGDFPLGAYSEDTFRAWLAQNAGRMAAAGTTAALLLGATAVAAPVVAPALAASAPMFMPAISGALGLGAGTALSTTVASATGSAIAPIVSTGASVASGLGSKAGVIAAVNLLGTVADRAVAPDRARGVAGNSISYARNRVGFMFYNYHITDEYAERIDKFFDMYGYKVNMTKVPNISSRPCWNYIKTCGCIVEGYIPADDAKAISQIFDSGIRFWKPNATFGDYSQDNSPA